MDRLHSFIDELEQDGYGILRLKHAYRINGNLDIYRRSYTVYLKTSNKYLNYKTGDEMFSAVKSMLIGTPKVKDFKQAKNGMQYREFKQQMYAIKDSSHAEDFHWRIDEKTGDDDMYFLFHRDTAKIGRTKDINKRLKQLLTGLSHDPVVYVFKGKGHMEKVMHNVFSSFKTSREWFKLDYRMKRFSEKYGEIIMSVISIIFINNV
jgi:rRNA maturation protein Rpf1